MTKVTIVKDKKHGDYLKWDGNRYDMVQYNQLDCCCFTEISGVMDFDAFTTLATLALNNALRSVVLFTTTNNDLHGDQLMDLIHKKRLGRVEFQGPFRNKNSGNNCWLYTWHVNEKAWSKFAAKIENLDGNSYRGPY